METYSYLEDDLDITLRPIIQPNEFPIDDINMSNTDPDKEKGYTYIWNLKGFKLSRFVSKTKTADKYFLSPFETIPNTLEHSDSTISDCLGFMVQPLVPTREGSEKDVKVVDKRESKSIERCSGC